MKKDERKQKGKKATAKSRKQAAKVHRGRQTNRNTKTGRKRVKRTKHISKIVKPDKVQLSPKSVRKSRKKSVKAIRKTQAKAIDILKYKRGSNRIKTSFKRFKEIDKKITAFNSSNELNLSIKKQLKRKGGKPPKSLIMIVRDKNGNEAAHVTDYSLVITEKSVKKELSKFTKELKRDYNRYIQRLSKLNDYNLPIVKSLVNKQLNHGVNFGIPQGYQNYNPDSIEGIDLQFIY